MLLVPVTKSPPTTPGGAHPRRHRGQAFRLVQQKLAGSAAHVGPVEVVRSADWPEGGCNLVGTKTANITASSQVSCQLQMPTVFPVFCV